MISTRRHRLAPRLRDQVRQALRPGWMRSMLVRRVLAGALAATALLLFLLDQRQAPGTPVVVAARDLRPGLTLTAADVTVLRLPVDVVPDGALRLSADARERTVTSVVRRGEVLTDSRLLGSRLPDRLTGDPGARIVPVHLADNGTAELLVPGDVVDVLTKGGPADPPAVIATNAVVALGASARAGRRGDSGSPVLLAMSAVAAHRVASAGLTTALTVVIH